MVDEKEKRKIYLTLNPKTFQQVNFPNVFGKTKREALSQLRAVGFKIGEFTYIKDAGLDVVRGASFRGEKIKLGDKLPKYAVLDLEFEQIKKNVFWNSDISNFSEQLFKT